MTDTIIDSIIAILLISVILFVVKYAGGMIESLSKKLSRRKYPLKKDTISSSDLRRNDIVTLKNCGECRYDGYYDGSHLFYPVNKEFDDYIKLNKSQISELVTKVTTKDLLKWEKTKG